jgi:hypothetical protein
MAVREGGQWNVTIRATIRFFDGCPSWQSARANLEVAAQRIGADIEVDLQNVETAGDAERLGFTGSPTLLLDGTDPFAVPGTEPALACRVYATPNGLAGSPTVDQLVSVLAAHERSH